MNANGWGSKSTKSLGISISKFFSQLIHFEFVNPHWFLYILPFYPSLLSTFNLTVHHFRCWKLYQKRLFDSNLVRLSCEKHSWHCLLPQCQCLPAGCPSGFGYSYCILMLRFILDNILLNRMLALNRTKWVSYSKNAWRFFMPWNCCLLFISVFITYFLTMWNFVKEYSIRVYRLTNLMALQQFQARKLRDKFSQLFLRIFRSWKSSHFIWWNELLNVKQHALFIK